jgi:hypothetical protein
MRKLVFILFLLNIILSCNSQNNKKDYIGTWLEIQKKGGDFVIVDCGYEGASIKVSNTSILEKGIIENSDFKIDHIKQDNDQIILFTDKQEKSYYKFFWENKEKGISKWEIHYDKSATVVKYYVNILKLKSIKTVKGTKKDCVTNDDVGDVVNDSFKIDNGNKVINIEDDNCISLKNKKDEMIFERCFENSIIHIRHIKGDFIPLTIINGQKSMDVDFFNMGNNWVSNSITYYSSSPTGEVKQTKKITISIKEFDFDTVVEQFGEMTSKKTSSLDVIKDKQKLMQMDIYAIADILKANPITKENITIYNNAAYNLIEAENYNEARIILLDIVSFSPDRVVAYLNLGDAQWGFDQNEKAKKSYQKYVELMKTQGKDLNKIPKRVYERIK